MSKLTDRGIILNKLVRDAEENIKSFFPGIQRQSYSEILSNYYSYMAKLYDEMKSMYEQMSTEE